MLLVLIAATVTGCVGQIVSASSEDPPSYTGTLSTSHEGALDVANQLALGTVRLEETEHAVTQEQASVKIHTLTPAVARSAVEFRLRWIPWQPL